MNNLYVPPNGYSSETDKNKFPEKLGNL